MGFIFDTFTIAGAISSACTILAVLFVLNCCKIRGSIKHRYKDE